MSNPKLCVSIAVNFSSSFEMCKYLCVNCPNLPKTCHEDKKRKITPVYIYRHEYEPIGRALITAFRDAMYNVMPPLGGGLWWGTS